MPFTVFTDTSANLLNRQIRDYDLRIIPFSYYIDGQEHTCLDTDAFNGDAYYSMLKGSVNVTTTQIIPETYAEYFKPVLESGSDIIFVSMSSGISGSCQSALVAANDLSEQFPDRRIEIVDTLGASLGEGLVALHAARLRDASIPASEAAVRLHAMSERMFNVFTVDNLLYLRRGGRLSNLSAIVGTVLNIKPILKGSSEGKIVSFGRVRGRKASIETLATLYDQHVSDPENQTVGIAHAGCKKDAEYLISLLNRNHPPKEILLVDYEPVTGSHVGPGALALFFESRKGVRDISRI
ncbi:MAG: DegV family protein [Clostridiales bacterium]|nr:DegV family protein [Clostridiales bacterium]